MKQVMIEKYSRETEVERATYAYQHFFILINYFHQEEAGHFHPT